MIFSLSDANADAAAIGQRLARLVGDGWGAAVDALMPPRCVSCKAPVAAAHLHCAACWETLLPPAGTRCSVGSLPLPGQWAAETVCLGCLSDPPPFRQARAPFRYAGAARNRASPEKWRLASGAHDGTRHAAGGSAVWP